jgi:hypothetical protein
MDPFHSLRRIVDEMQGATEVGLYSVALLTAVALPDICAGVAEPPKGHPGQGLQARYEAWCDLYLVPKYTIRPVYQAPGAAAAMEAITKRTGRDPRVVLTAKDCWYLRGGIAHQATLEGRKGAPIARILFTFPNPPSKLHMQKQIVGLVEYVQIDLVQFCADMAQGVEEWCADHADNADVLSRVKGLITRQPITILGQPMEGLA